MELSEWRAVGAPIVLKGTHFEQVPALPGLPGSATTRPFGSGRLIGKMVAEAQNAPPPFQCDESVAK